MTKATTQITDKFKRTYLHCVTPESFEQAQRLMFKMGFKWTGDSRKVTSYGYGNYLYVDNDNRLMWSDDATGPYPYPLEELPLYREITRTELENAVELYTLAKRQDSKASKKRRALRKWEATAIKNDGTEPEGIVTVKFNNGEIFTGDAGDYCWEVGDWAYDIASYKVLVPNKHKPKQETVTSDQMFAAICDDLGKGIAMQVGSLSSIGGPVGTLTTGNLTISDQKGDVILDANGNVVASGFYIQNAPDTKDEGRTNPKDALGDKKVPLWLLSPVAKANWAVCQYVGMAKYGAWNWREMGVRSSVYLSAMQRHMDAYLSGEEGDPVDGTKHLGHIMACCAILLDAEAAGKLTDDRPPVVGIREAYASVEAQMVKAKENYAHMNPRHYTIADTEK